MAANMIDISFTIMSWVCCQPAWCECCYD